MSRIGKKAIGLPKDVKVELKEGRVFVEGPKGKISRPFSDRLTLEIKDSQVFVTRKVDTKLDRSLHGLHRSLILGMIKGVVDGYTKEMEIVGVGFKAFVKDGGLSMNLGYSHPVEYKPPEGVKIEVPKPTQIIISGIDKEKVGEMAAKIRRAYPPEPYKGKGVRFAGEYIKKKVGKAQATGGGGK